MSLGPSRFRFAVFCKEFLTEIVEWRRENVCRQFRKNSSETSRCELAERVGFFPLASQNINKDGRFQHNSQEANNLAFADSFVRCRLFASVFGLCQRDDTRNDTRRERRRIRLRRRTRLSVNTWRQGRTYRSRHRVWDELGPKSEMATNRQTESLRYCRQFGRNPWRFSERPLNYAAGAEDATRGGWIGRGAARQDSVGSQGGFL